jgi:hypothetical protein
LTRLDVVFTVGGTDGAAVAASSSCLFMWDSMDWALINQELTVSSVEALLKTKK